MNETLRECCAAAGQMFTIGFEGSTPTPFVERFLGSHRGGGVILFRRNMVGPEEILELNGALRRLASHDVPYIMVDQEGGPVMRLRDWATPMPAMALVGSHKGVVEARRAGQILGEEVRALGFNVNCAPVLDVNSNPDNPIIGERSFSEEPDRVAELGEAFVRGMQGAGVLACGKHFPGHGDTDVDSHLALPILSHSLERLRAVELVPFRHVIRTASPAMIMTAHILFPELDPDFPCTLSPTVIPRLLRDELKFGGVVVTDDLEMKAIADQYDMEQVVQQGLLADVDVFLICKEEWRQQAAMEALHKLIVDGGVSVERIQRSLRRISRTKTPLNTSGIPSVEAMRRILACERHVEWATRVGMG